MDVREHRVLVWVLAVLAVCGCLFAGAAVVAAGGSAGGDAASSAPAASALQEDEPSLNGYDDLHVGVDIRANGSAAWVLEYRYRLDDNDNDNETVDWEELEADIEEQPEAYLEMIEDRWSETASEAAAETGRNMSTSSYAVETDETTTPQEYGVVRFGFEWRSFAHVEVNRIEAGDALEGFELDERMQLVVSWPESYNGTAVEPSPDDSRDSAVVWDGEETEFLDDEPRLELLETGGDPVEAPEDPTRELPLSWIAAAIVALLAVVGVTGLWYVRGDEGEDHAQEPVADPQPEAHPTAPSNGPPLELLSNEERVLRLLETHGGRIKQQEVVSELEWTEAKTSQVVSGLREREEIDVFRIGRENVLTIPDDGDGELGDRSGDETPGGDEAGIDE